MCPGDLSVVSTLGGNNPVEEFIEALPVADGASLRAWIDFLAEVGNRAREPLSKSLGSGLFEL